MFLSMGAASLVTGGESFRFEIAGADGAREFTFSSGTTLTSIASQINTNKSVTGGLQGDVMRRRLVAVHW
jgi:hypothetical protein